MERIKRTEKVLYTPSEMYRLVNDVESYPDFLPWCKSTKILSFSDKTQKIVVSMAMGKLQYTLVTLNSLKPNERIDMRLVQGPLKQLEGYWHFSPMGNANCLIEFAVAFEFKNKLTQHALGRFFHKITDSLVETFITRAETVYGHC